MGETQFSIEQIRAENYRVYYRIFADGVELPSVVCIYASQKNRRSDEELKARCRKNAWRLDTGTIVHADLGHSEEKTKARGT